MMRERSAIRVVLADDHRLVRAGLRSLLASLGDVQVVGEASDGNELLQLLDTVQADVVVTDIRMPNSDGIAALRRIRERLPGMKVIVLSMDDSVESVRNALAGGANGYLRKDAPASELATALRAVMVSDSYFGTGVIQRLAEPVPREVAQLLTQRQVELLVLLADGKSTKEIAFELQVSTKTVELHRRRVMDQLELNDVASLTRYALRTGLIAP